MLLWKDAARTRTVLRVFLCTPSKLRQVGRYASFRASSRQEAMMLVTNLRDRCTRVSSVNNQVFLDLTRQARAVLQHCRFDVSNEIWYWLRRLARKSGHVVEDELFMSYLSSIKGNVSCSTDEELIRILRTLEMSLNKNKIARAVSNNEYLHLEDMVHRMLAESLPRFQIRHRYFDLTALTTMLSVYAKLFRPEYRVLFNDVKRVIIGHVTSSRMKYCESRRWGFFRNGPYILVAYAQARCPDSSLFDCFLEVYEKSLHELSYESVSMTAYAVAQAGMDRPNLWTNIAKDITMSGKNWSMRALGQVMGACRKMLSVEADIRSTPWTVMKLVFSIISACPDKVGCNELTDLVMALALLPIGAIGEDETLRMVHFVSHGIVNTCDEFPPTYIAGAFFAIVAILEFYANEALESALSALAQKMPIQICMCETFNVDMIAQALWALVRRESAERLKSLKVDAWLLVQQREIVRKAHTFKDLTAFLRVAYLTGKASAAAGSIQDGNYLQHWFPAHILLFVTTAMEGQARNEGGLEQNQLDWFACAAADGVDEVDPLPPRIVAPSGHPQPYIDAAYAGLAPAGELRGSLTGADVRFHHNMYQPAWKK